MSAIPLTKLKRGAKAKVVAINAGKLANLRLSTLGVRPGVSLTKVSSFVLRGPVTIKAGTTTLALGHGMAEKVMVEPQP